jgi:PAS domain S-box-containing protein
VEVQFLSARIKQTESELALFFDQSLDLLCIAGIDGYFKRLNPAWTTCLGWTLKELQAKPFLDFVHPDDRAATQALIDRRNQGEKVILFENRYRHLDGSYRWLCWNTEFVPGHQSVYATARDVTDQRRLEQEILEIADKEREHLGRELHDGLCQTLAGVAALSSALSKGLTASPEAGADASAAAADEIASLLNEAIDEARYLARGLGPVGLYKTGLEGALADLAVNVWHQHHVSCTFACDYPFPRLTREIELHLFRITQEAVNNALTHGGGDRIEISLGSKGGKGVLSIRDNGVGMGVTDRARNQDGIGMYTMTYRGRLIGGFLKVRRCTPRGTAITCTFSLSGLRSSARNRTMPAITNERD